MSTHSITAKAAATAALLIVGGLALAPEARASSNPQGRSMNGLTLNGMTLNGRELNGSHAQGRATRDDAADLGALRVRAVRLPDGRTLLLRQR